MSGLQSDTDDAPMTRVLSADANEHLRMRLVGLAKAINEEMQPGAREFCLAAEAEVVDTLDDLARRLLASQAEVARLREALSEITSMAAMLYGHCHTAPEGSLWPCCQQNGCRGLGRCACSSSDECGGKTLMHVPRSTPEGSEE